MSFLRFSPCVFVIGEEYEILLHANENGLLAVEIDGEIYYEENTGVLSTEKTYARIRVPQAALDRAKKYTAIWRKSIDRKAYFSVLGDPERTELAFSPIEKTNGIHIYHMADVHYYFEIAKRTFSHVSQDLDLLILNGDIGEVETEEHYLEVCRFVGELSKGRIPVIFVRGNHDTRGHLAERYTDYFPSNGKDTFYTFSVGPLCGVALDCGEDKYDEHEEYGGVNAFEAFRRRETAFLRSVTLPKDKIRLAISHICPAQPADAEGSIHNIDREVYREWNRELARMEIGCMICGHMHQCYLLKKNDAASLHPHDFPVVVGSVCEYGKSIWGADLWIENGIMRVRFTDQDGVTHGTHTVDLTDGEIAEVPE